MSTISVKKTVLQKNSAFSELYTWEYLSIHDVQVLILSTLKSFANLEKLSIKYSNSY